MTALAPPPRRRRRVRALVGSVLVAVVLTGCSDSAETDAADARAIANLDAGVPPRLAGYEVVKEDIAEELDDTKRPYFDAVSLYSFREEELLQATLQVGHFADDVDLDDEEFRDTLIANIGASARELRMGDQLVYVTGADRQTLTAWFKDRHLFILSTREGFDGGRTVLREAIGIVP